jgi:hypothetical protein
MPHVCSFLVLGEGGCAIHPTLVALGECNAHNRGLLTCCRTALLLVEQQLASNGVLDGSQLIEFEELQEQQRELK